MAVLLLPLLFGAAQAFRVTGSDVRQWLPDSFQETRDYDEFSARFGSDEVLVVSWPGCTSADPRLGALVDRLRTDSSPATRYFSRIVSGPELVQQLVSSESGISSKTAHARLENVAFGPDRRTTAMIAWLDEAGTADRHAAIEAVYLAAEEIGLARDEIHMGGPTMESVALDTESQRSRGRLSLLAGLCASVLGWHCLRNWRLIFIVFGVAMYCASTSLAMVYFTGKQLNILMMSMPTLIYVLGISAGIHWVNYLRKAAARSTGANAVEMATREAMTPVLLTAFTTAIGLVSLATSQVEPIRMFGLYSAAGVLLSVPILLLLVPALTTLLVSTDSLRVAGSAARSRGWFQRLLVRSRLPVLGMSLAVMIVLGIGVSRLHTSVHLMNLFSDDTRIIQDYTWLESNVGPLVPVEVVLDFPQSNHVALIDRIRLVSKIQESLNDIPGVVGSLSAATWAPPIPEGTSLRSFSRRRWLGLRLEQQLTALEQTGFLVTDADRQSFRISARVESLSRPDYGVVAERIRESIDTVLAREGSGSLAAEPSESDVSVTVTGAMPLVYKAQRVLLQDLLKSFAGATVVIGITLMVLLRSVTGGLLALIPNLFPALITFGGMGWAGILCDVGAMMTASVAMGISVDDTIHFLFGYRRERLKGLSAVRGTLAAVSHCGVSMWQTTLICSVSMLAFTLSNFVPTANFALLMFSMLGLALFADLVILPAMLLSGAGRFVDAKQS
jgi:predicted RND superfamily exporter protein